MSNLLFSLNVTVPIFLVILLGYFIRRIGVVSDGFIDVANKYVFQIALPVMLFKDIAMTDTLSHVKVSFVMFCTLTTVVMFMLVWFASILFIKDKSLVGAFAQASSRGSAAILGVAFVENICGNAGMAPLMIVAAVPFFNILSVIILIFSAELAEGEGSVDKHAAVKKSLKGIATNPIILSILAGILFSLTGLDMPAIPARTINYVAQTATPLALIAIGGGFKAKEAMTRLKPAVVASIVKLVVLPGVFLPVAALFGFDKSEMAAILVMLAAPTTISCYIMAKNMKNDSVLTSNVILITTIVSSLTLTMWVFILRSFGLV
jgi:predicted permease